MGQWDRTKTKYSKVSKAPPLNIYIHTNIVLVIAGRKCSINEVVK